MNAAPSVEVREYGWRSLAPDRGGGAEGLLCQERILSGTRMGQHDNRGVLGEVRFPRAASGMLTWLRVTGMG